MAAIARSMSNRVGRIIVDKTGLIGGFDLELEFSPDPSAAGGQLPAVSDTNLPSLFTALEEQLGLKLVPGGGRLRCWSSTASSGRQITNSRSTGTACISTENRSRRTHAKQVTALGLLSAFLMAFPGERSCLAAVSSFR